MAQVDAGLRRQVCHRQVAARAHAPRAVRQLALAGLHIGQQFLQVAHRHAGADGEQVAAGRAGARDRREIPDRVIGQRRRGPRVHRQRGGIGEQQRVAVRRGAGHGLAGDDAVGAGTVVDDDRLLQRRGQALGDQPCGLVGHGAGARGQHHADGSVRVGGLGVRAGGARQGQCRNQGRAGPAGASVVAEHAAVSVRRIGRAAPVRCRLGCERALTGARGNLAQAACAARSDSASRS
ncbi:hypothetical protein D9M72_411260 [compost metagenome]